MNHKCQFILFLLFFFSLSLGMGLLFFSKKVNRSILDICVLSEDMVSVDNEFVQKLDFPTFVKSKASLHYPRPIIRISVKQPIPLDLFKEYLSVCYDQALGPLELFVSNQYFRVSLDRVSDTINTLYENPADTVFYVEFLDKPFRDAIACHYGRFPFQESLSTNALSLEKCPVSVLVKRIIPSSMEGKLQVILPSSAQPAEFSKLIQATYFDLLLVWNSHHRDELTYLGFDDGLIE